MRAYTSCGGVYDPSDEGFDAFVAKLDSSGNLLWNTFLGGSGADHCQAIVLDPGGNICVSGESNVTWGSPMRLYTSGTGEIPPYDAFVTKLDGSSGAIIWNTFLGGSGWDEGYAVAVDGNGNIYVGGQSNASWGSPTQAYSGNGYNAFASKLDSSGNLIWNTFQPGNCYAITVDSSGNNVYFAGSSGNWGSPMRAYGGGGSDVVAVKLTGSNGALTWNTFLGGTGIDYCYGGIAVDSSGNVYVGGYSNSTWGSPMRAYTSGGGFGNDAFASKLSSSGALIWNTFLGGSGDDQLFALALDGSGNNVYVVGNTTDTLATGNVSWGSPVQTFTYGGAPGYASEDAFAVKLNTSSGALVWNTFLGGNSVDRGSAIAVDGSGNIYVAGTSYAAWGSPVRAFTTGEDAFVAKLDYHTPPTVAITYSVSGPYKSGAAVTITATFSSAMAVAPVPQISISGVTGSNLSATNMTRSSATVYTYAYTAGTGDGTATVALSTGTDLAGNVVTSAPTSGAAFTVDNTPPTASITYSPNHPVKAGTSLLITATFSQAMVDSPAPQIAISGNNTITATAMTKTDTTHYTYTYTVGTGDGTDTVALSAGTDLAGNVVTSTPTSGANFTVDNTPPTNENTVFHTNTYKNGGVAITITSSGDATNSVWFAPSGTTTFNANGNMTAAGGTATTILTPADDGVYKLYVIDAAGNYSVASTATLTVDNIPPSISISAPSVSYVRSSQQVTYTITYYDLNFYICSLSISNITLNTTGTAAGSKAVTGSGGGGTGTTRTVTISNITGNGTIGISITTGTATDIANNHAPASGPSATFTVDNTAPTNQDSVFASSASVTHGTPVTIVSSASSGGAANDSIWFAPSGTSGFTAGPTMTTAGGTDTCIQAPANPGTYNLFVVDAAGNASAASTATLTIQ